MHLTRLLLNPLHRDVRGDLADPQRMHRTVMRGFPDGPAGGEPARARHAVLHRLDVDARAGRITLYVQSRARPDYASLTPGYLIDTEGAPPNPATRDLDEAWSALLEGAVLTFRLRANPTRKVDTKTGPDGKRRHGRRVELRGDDARLAWLDRKAEEGGFALAPTPGGEAPDVRVTEERRLSGWRSDGHSAHRLAFGSVLYEGRLRVVDAARFRATLEAGVGPAKAYGFGLLSIARA
ncbi:MAG: type I-E CRISPR-associated protein Cas6/Cse3/CasE [Polyangiaceae bacterium]|nr:type I-E CRISPR-associated protein Cas6/Cse3/CasE [Polyangiaceae bacterium]